MARPEVNEVTFEIDGQEVRAPEGTWLVDACKYGDIEIPYFCYERKLGGPIGACRMCIVEIEGSPKLEVSCATAVKDGMVVTTTSERVKKAQNAIVEFLLVNHPLDCPVCDKGGECPLQDISFGWGAGRSRFIEPKRHFRKPVELSPLVAIDRERCILCFRCVRFSQEVSEDYQLVFLERGDHTYVGTHDGHPYVGPFSGNIIDLCPVGALTSNAYRFRARPWDVEEAGSLCTLCPSQCNVRFTIRDDAKVLRTFPRDNYEVDDGWMCDKGRFGYQAIHHEKRLLAPMVREGEELVEVSWERALAEAARALQRAGAKTAALAGGATTNEEGFVLQHLMREALGSPHLDSRAGGALDAEQARILASPALSARVSDIDHAGAVLVVDTELVEEAPILDLRVRKAARRNDTKVVTLTSRPSSLDPNAEAKVRFAPGAAEAAVAALAAELGSARLTGQTRLHSRAGTEPGSIGKAAAVLREAEDVVVIWGERISHGLRGDAALDALLAVAGALALDWREESGLIEVPAETNARGLREVGVLPNLAPGLEDARVHGMAAGEIAGALAAGELETLVLVHADPLATHPERGRWEAALAGAGAVIAFADFLTPGLVEHATVVFPAESHAEKEGTVCHPDGRLQRLRQAIGHPGEVRPEWSVLAELAARCGADLGKDSAGMPNASNSGKDSAGMPNLSSGSSLLTAPMAFHAMTEAVSFYSGLTLEEIGGKGVRWQDRKPATRLRTAGLPGTELAQPPELPEGIRLGAVSSLWTGATVEHTPSLRFLVPTQRAELAPADARQIGVTSGDEVEVSADGSRVRATVALRQAVVPGSLFLVAGTTEHNATALMNGAPRTVDVVKVDEGAAGVDPSTAASAASGPGAQAPPT